MRRSGLGAFVARRRADLGMTQTELAERIGIKSGYMSMIETGARKWPQHLIPALARELGVSQVSLAVAAGILPADAVEAGAGRCPLFPEDDPRFAIAADLRDLDDGELVAVRALIAGLRGHRRFRQRPAPDPVGAGVDG